MKKGLAWKKVQIFIHGHLLNPLWGSRKQRHDKRIQATVNAIEEYVLEHYLEAAVQKANKCQTGAAEQSKCVAASTMQTGPERVWSLWLQGEENAPALVRNCFASIRHYSGLETIVLDQNSLQQYISLPEVIVEKYKKGKIKACHFADICRVELLYQYGGYWMDATCLMTAPAPQNIQEADFFMPLTSPGIIGDYSGFQNCYIRAKKGSWLLKAWREMILDYWTHEEGLLDYFQHQIMFKTLVEKSSQGQKEYEKMPRITHEAAQQLWLLHGDEDYSEEKWAQYTRDSFFQKCSHKDSQLKSGSIKEYIVNKWHISEKN